MMTNAFEHLPVHLEFIFDLPGLTHDSPMKPQFRFKLNSYRIAFPAIEIGN